MKSVPETENALGVIRECYDGSKWSRNTWNYFSQTAYMTEEILRRTALKALIACGFDSIGKMETLHYLDVGCEFGKNCRFFMETGVKPGNIHGVDLIQHHIDTARQLSPNINFYCRNAEILPFKDGSFGLLSLFVVLCIIPSEQVRQNIAREVDRVLAEDGILLFYDWSVVDFSTYFPDYSIVYEKRIGHAPGISLLGILGISGLVRKVLAKIGLVSLNTETNKRFANFLLFELLNLCPFFKQCNFILARKNR